MTLSFININKLFLVIIHLFSLVSGLEKTENLIEKVHSEKVYVINETENGIELIFYSNENDELLKKKYPLSFMPNVKKISGDLYKVTESFGVNCNYTFFVDVEKEKVSDSYFNILFYDEKMVAFIEKGTIFLTDIFDTQKVITR